MLKPFSEYLLVLDVLTRTKLYPDESRASMEWAWDVTMQGDDLLTFILARPDLADLAGACSVLLSAGFQNERLVSGLRTIISLSSSLSFEGTPWRRCAQQYALRRLGLYTGAIAMQGTWLAAMPEPWTICDASAYAVTHEVLYVTDFGAQRTALGFEIIEYLKLWLPSWTTFFIEESNWDLAAEFLTAGLCVGAEEWVAATVPALISQQHGDGMYSSPRGAGVYLFRGEDDLETRRFLANYHTSLVALLCLAMAVCWLQKEPWPI